MKTFVVDANHAAKEAKSLLVSQELGSQRHTRQSRGSTYSRGGYFRLATLYFLVYCLINFVTTFHEFSHTTITVWSPDNGLSVLLLLESSLFTPVVLMTSILVDLFVAKSNADTFSIFMSDFIVTQGYLLIAIVLRDAFKFDFREATYANMIALLAVVPTSAAFTGFLYCGALYLTGSLAGVDLLTGFKYFWIGDAVGMIVLIPAATAAYDIVVNRKWRALLKPARLAMMCAMLTGMVLLIVISIEVPNSRYLFSLLFLPTIWVGIAYGYNAVAISLATTQLLLVGSLATLDPSLNIFASFQTQMFILAATGQLLGAAVTEREEATRNLRRQQFDLARLTAQATTGALAAAFAHEVSQPLSSLSGYVHAARRLLTNQDDREGAIVALQKAETESRRAREIVGRIREFVASGKLELQDCDLREVAEKIASLNREDGRARDVDLQLEAPETPVIARIDKIAIEQALNNLVVNAIEAVGAQNGGARHVWVRVSADPDHAWLAVDDDGPGIAEEIVDHLFDAFETTKPKGMGLGLTLASQVVTKHSGRLTWRARQPRGATFLIELPRHAAIEVNVEA
jgi:signal transduction histidine kinase